MTRALVFAAIVAAALSAPALSQLSFLIQGDYRIGAYAVKVDGSFAGAIDVFGAPTARRRGWAGVGCNVAWRPIGLSILFYNLGGGDACAPASGRFRTATMSGPLWKTSKGLAVGDSVAKLRRIYPRATPHGRAWWLVTRFTRIGDNRNYPGLRAVVANGRVRAFVIEYAAGGD